MNNNIALLHSHYHLKTPTPNHHRTSLKCSSDNKHTIPARDRVIDFGKHKGKMLGTLPSSYLKWVSKTLRARHFEDWAKLADQVLQDPLYQDRLEWEFAQNVLDGNRTSSSSSGVADLLEISQRFGWDNEDKLGWSRVDFELLGTSKSGRIPRVDGEKSGGKGGGKRGGKVEDEREGGGSGSGRRSERRERVKLRMRKERREEKLGFVEKGRGSLAKESVDSGNEVGLRKKVEMGEVNNPFPGRQAFLKNLLGQKRFS